MPHECKCTSCKCKESKPKSINEGLSKEDYLKVFVKSLSSVQRDWFEYIIENCDEHEIFDVINESKIN